MAGKSFIFRFGDVEVREREFSIVKAGEVLAVEPKAFRVLLFLLRNPQKLIPKEELLNAVWGDAAVTENSLTRSIALLRKLLGDESRNPRYIETVTSVGYRFLCKVEVSEESSGAGEAPPEPVVAPRMEKKAESRKLVWVWVLAGGTVLGAGLAATIWHLRRPLPPPRITKYTQITHDGQPKFAGGTDGSRLYVNLFADGLIYQVETDGGRLIPLQIAVPGAPEYARDVSPDGSHLLVSSTEKGKSVPTIWNVGILGGPVYRLGFGSNAA